MVEGEEGVGADGGGLVQPVAEDLAGEPLPGRLAVELGRARLQEGGPEKGGEREAFMP